MAISIAFIPLAPAAKLSPSAIKADLAAKWPDLPQAVTTPAEKQQIAFRIGNGDVIIALMPAPIPWSDLQGPCQTSWLWPNAEAALKNHVAHLIVTVLSEDGPIERARLLTQVCASILATCQQTPGVYWPAACLVLPCQMFLHFATELMKLAPPVHLWVDFRVGKSASGGSCGFTHGMAELGLKELEVLESPESPDDLRERMINLASYILDEYNAEIRDGDTVGDDACERIRVVFADSAFGHTGKVMRLIDPGDDPREFGFDRDAPTDDYDSDAAFWRDFKEVVGVGKNVHIAKLTICAALTVMFLTLMVLRKGGDPLAMLLAACFTGYFGFTSAKLLFYDAKRWL